MKQLLAYFLSLITLLFIGQVVQASEKLVLGVYQYQSKESVQNQYQGFADYLSDSLPNHDVNLKVYNPTELLSALQNKQVQLLLVNPNLYEILRTKVSLNGITATQQLIHEGYALDQLGGVIFTKQSSSQIHRLSDLINQRIAIPSKNNTGAYRVPLYEIYKADIDYKKLTFTQVGDNDSVIEAVLSGEADVGFVRTGILEKWRDANRLKLDQIRIINPQKHPDFPHLVSTALYPEWPFVILPGLDENLNRDIAVALFALRAEHPAAQQAGIKGFVAPRDYQKFENVLRTLKLYPYDTQPDITLLELWQQYTTEILLFLFLFILILALLVITERRKEVITLQEQRLKKQNHVDQVLLELPKYAETHTEGELLQCALDEIEKILLSPISFIHSVDPSQETIQLLAWSNNTLQTYCDIESYEDHHPISKAGVWAEAARKKHPVIINDYANYKDKQGMPEGHAVLNRMISLPIVEHDKVVMIAGLGNKDTEYTQDDVNTFQLILNEIWRTIKLNRTNQKIVKQKNEFERLLNDLGDDYMVFSHNGAEGILSYVSAGFTTLFEQPVESILNRPWFLDIDWLPESIDIANKSVQSLISGERTTDSFKLQFYTPNYQKLKTILVQQQAVYENDKFVSIDGLITDITHKNESEQRLKQAATVFESANEGILICDKNNTIVRANQRVEEITGYSEVELIGKNPKIFSSGDQDNKFYKAMWEQLILAGTWEGELWNRRQNGQVYPQRLKISTVFDDNKVPAYFIGLLSDITFEKEHQDELEKMAHFDALTNLPNRFLLSDRISQAIHSIHRTDEMIAILFVDLDGFKLVNDTYGHQAGDYLLKTLANRLSNSVREGDTVARIGGDEFVVVISSTKNIHEFSFIEQRLLTETSKKVMFESNELNVSSSIGAVYYGHQYGKDMGSEQLLRLADQAMYQAKQQGKNRIQHYAWDNLQGKAELIEAFKQKEFELYYQPKVNCKTGEIISLEGLIRWNHPEKGVVPPFAFLQQIEQFDLTDQLSEFVIQEGVSYLERLNLNSKTKIGISLNIQGNNLLHEDFINNLLACFANNSNISPQQVTLEILESASLEAVEKIASQIKLLKAKGFKFAIDDFGTGHASLTYLKNLPVNEVKIDQEFIRGIFNEPNSLSIIEAIKSMAEAFNLNVVAEGAETSEHIELLLQLGVESIQGYGIAKPMNEADVDAWINQWKTNQKWSSLKEVAPQNKQL
ncbi:MAG: EAL domain-containing protein, partial [Pseudomonadota bacterium]|nr:EAL domain-containing protein [Pseudomonadota bacterium]